MLKKLFYESKLSHKQIYELNSALEFFEKEFNSLDPRTLAILRSEISRITNIFVSDYKISKIFCPEKKDLNFKGFSSIKKTKKSTIRTIYDIKIKKTKKEIQITYTGNGFLHNMVRILTGTLVEVGCGKIKPADITKALESTKRADAGITAPPQGLFLVSVEY